MHELLYLYRIYEGRKVIYMYSEQPQWSSQPTYLAADHVDHSTRNIPRANEAMAFVFRFNTFSLCRQYEQWEVYHAQACDRA